MHIWLTLWECLKYDACIVSACPMIRINKPTYKAISLKYKCSAHSQFSSTVNGFWKTALMRENSWEHIYVKQGQLHVIGGKDKVVESMFDIQEVIDLYCCH